MKVNIVLRLITLPSLNVVSGAPGILVRLAVDCWRGDPDTVVFRGTAICGVSA